MPPSARFSPLRADVEQTLTTTGRLLCTGTVFAMAEVTASVGYLDARPERQRSSRAAQRMFSRKNK